MGNPSGVLDIQVCLNTGVILVVSAAMNKDSREVGINCILAELLEEGLQRKYSLDPYMTVHG